MSYGQYSAHSVRQTKTSAFGGKPPASARKVANNTFSYETEDGCKVFRLHTTDVVKRLPDGRIVLNSGGWRSVTTKDRMNAFATGYHVYSGKGGWRVGRGGKSVAFYDDMILPDAIDNPSAEEQSAQREADEKKLRREIANFSKLYLENLPMPSAGDCWLCMLPDGGDPEHLREHIKEGYAHGTLALNAMRWNGWTDTRIGMTFRGTFPGGRKDAARAVRRYLQFKLGLPY